MSDDDESPTTYTKPDTPEIDKLRSLMNSSPESSISTPSKSRSIKEELSFHEKLEKYYELKCEYDQKLRDAHMEWNSSNPPMSLEKKKEKYSEFMAKRLCINCGKGPGGTIFLQSGIGETRKVTAMCGCEEKCNLNIEIYLGETEDLLLNMESHKNKIESLKKELTEYKLDLLFNLRDEEVVLTEFRTIKDQLTESLDEYLTYKKLFSRKNELIKLGDKTIELFNNLKEEVEPNEDNEYIVSRQKYLNVMQKHLNNLISTFKEKTKEYKKEPTRAKLKANFEFLKHEIQPVQDDIRNQKYHMIYLDSEENIKKKGTKKEKIMYTYSLNPVRYDPENLLRTTGNKVTKFMVDR